MGLKDFVQEPDVAAQLRPMRSKEPRRIRESLKVSPRTKRYALVGSAFDYLLRFELQRRAPHAHARRWSAENAAEILSLLDEEQQIKLPKGKLRKLENIIMEHRLDIEAVISLAKKAVAAYVKNSTPSADDLREIASQALQLAKYEPLCRAGKVDPLMFVESQPEDGPDVNDLLDLVAIVPFNELIHDKVVLLNPAFGESSASVGGADADLIVGNMLVEFKVTKKMELETRTLDQLLGYFILARRERVAKPSFPEIDRVGVYLARHGILWTMATRDWTEQSRFAEIEDWFWKRAQERS